MRYTKKLCVLVSHRNHTTHTTDCLHVLDSIIAHALIQSQLLAYIRGLCHDEAIHTTTNAGREQSACYTLVRVLLQKMSADQQTSVVKQA